MKKIKIITVLIILFFHISFQEYAQTPRLWGATFGGGPLNSGIMYRINGDGSGFTDFFNWSGFDGYQNREKFSLFNHNGKLYGTTLESNSSSDTSGFIFSYDTLTGIYTDLYAFITNVEGVPHPNLTLAQNGKFYGIASRGLFFYGELFSFDPLTNIYVNLHDFDNATGNFLGTNQNLILATNGLLYGTTDNGGSFNHGVIFSFDPNTNIYHVLYNFSSSFNNRYYTLLQANNGLLYGLFESDTAYSYGGVYSFNVSTNSYSIIYGSNTFHDSLGYNYRGGSLMQANNGMLYGMWLDGGGSSSNGVIFSLDPITHIYTRIHSFNGIDGSKPLSTLMQASDGKIYGVTSQGGIYNKGVIFNYEQSTQTFIKIHDFNDTLGTGPQSELIEFPPLIDNISSNKIEQRISIYPNPSSSVLSIHLSTPSSCQLLITDVLGNCISQHTLSAQDSKLDVSKWSNGIYFYEVRSRNQSTRGKFVVQH